MNPIHDSSGNVVAWLRDGRVLDLGGETIAVVRGENVFDNGGVQRGRYASGWFRDMFGDAVAFTKGASGGPIPPIPSIPPIPPIPSIPPIPAIPQIPQIPAIPSLGWSARSFRAVFH